MFTVFWNLMKPFYNEYTTILIAYTFYHLFNKRYRSKSAENLVTLNYLLNPFMTKFKSQPISWNYFDLSVFLDLFWVNVPLLSPLKISENQSSFSGVFQGLYSHCHIYLSNFAKCEQAWIYQSRQLIFDLQTPITNSSYKYCKYF